MESKLNQKPSQHKTNKASSFIQAKNTGSFFGASNKPIQKKEASNMEEEQNATLSESNIQLKPAAGAGIEDNNPYNSAAPLVGLGHSNSAQQQSNSANSTSTQGYKVPVVEQARPNTMSIEDFITLVEQEEAKYSEEERMNTSVMITRIRKIFYGAPSWDTHLINGVENIDSPYPERRERERSRETVRVPGILNNFDVVDKENYPVNENGNRPEIYSNQEVKLPDGTFVDVGHVFAGIDAFNHRHSVNVPILSSIGIDNVEGTTWVGDLGSVLAEAQIDFVNGGLKKLSDSHVQDIIDDYAPARDMLGNIDAYVIADGYDIDATNDGMTVSQILRDYYLGEGVRTNQTRRYKVFTQGIGLTGWDGSAWNNEEARIAHYRDQVNDAAALYIAAGTGGLGRIPGGAFAVGMSMNQGASHLVEAFFEELRRQMIAESR